MEAALAGPLAAWRKLRQGIGEFETVFAEIEEKQSQALAAKKRLAEDTKTFKRLSDQERLVNLPELLKGYQAEIDVLSKRSKFSEAAFTELLKQVREALAPRGFEEQLQGLLLQSNGGDAVHEQLKQKDVQIAKLQEAAKDLETELRQVTNQAATVRRLEKQLKEMDAVMDAHLGEACRLKDEEWSKRVDDVQQEMQRLIHQKDIHEAEMGKLREQVLSEQEKAREASAAWSLEVDTLSNELEKLQAELEQERLGHSEHQESHGSVLVLQSLLEGAQRRAAVLERESGELQQQIAEADKRLQRAEAGHALATQEQQAVLVAKGLELQSLQRELELRPTCAEVEELRVQIRNAATVELTDVDGATTDLERRLLGRQKVLEGHLSEARVQTSSLESETTRLRQLLASAEDEAKDLRSLVSRLELEVGGGSSATPPPAIPVLEPDASSGANIDEKGMPSMLDILTGQRDRLRERIGELEQERDRWRGTADEERKRAEQLKADNVKLVERTRYLQSYQPKQGGRRGRSKLGGDGDIESRYLGYGENVNPLEQFREEERARRVADLNLGERFLVTSGNLIISSRPIRLFTLFYAAMLHLLVFIVLYRLAWNHTQSECVG